MCYGATCPDCSKKSWRGCGSHIPAALEGIPESQWCTCEPRVDVAGKSYPPAARMQIPGVSWISGFFSGGSEEKKGKGEL